MPNKLKALLWIILTVPAFGLLTNEVRFTLEDWLWLGGCTALVAIGAAWHKVRSR